jgi:hypothetical protein
MAAYSSPMDGASHRELHANRDPTIPTETALRAALKRYEAQFAAGQIVSGDEVSRELDESIARMEAKHSGGVPRRTNGLPPYEVTKS